MFLPAVFANFPCYL